MLSQHHLEQLLVLAAKAAEQAGRYIAKFDRNTLQINNKGGYNSKASQVVTQVDLACEAIIFEQLQPSCEQFNIAFLGEESVSNYTISQHPRLSKPYFWCVDPLDGTLSFIENVPGYAVSIALLNQAGAPILGVVYDPVQHVTFQALTIQNDLGNDAVLLKNSKPWSLEFTSSEKSKPQMLSLYFDRSFTHLPIYLRIIESLKQRAVKLGYDGIEVYVQAGAVMNALQVMSTAPACYFKFPKSTSGGGSLWDFAATSAIAKAAGIWVSDIHGKSLQLNAPETLFMNQNGIIYASDQYIANEIMLLFKCVEC